MIYSKILFKSIRLELVCLKDQKYW